MKNLLKKFSSIAVAVGLTFSLGAGTTYVALASATTLRTVQTPSIHLYAGISGTATSARVTPYPKDLDGNKLTMTDFGSNPTLTVDPKISGYEEIIGFTGMTDNGDNTATLTGLTRDLTSKYPYTTAGTGRTHGAGATVVFGNNPQIYGRLGALENDQTWAGVNTFSSTSQPKYDVNPGTWVSQLSLIDKAYADGLSIQGAATSTFANMGIVQLATQTQVQNGTASSTEGRPLVLSTVYSTSTCQMTGANALISSSTTGKLSGNCLDTAYANTWSKIQTFSATTSIAASGTSTSPLILNGVAYAFPSTNGASSSVAVSDGNGNVTWSPYVGYIASSTTNSVSTSGTATSTIASTTIPANALASAGVVKARIFMSSFAPNAHSLIINLLYDNTVIASTSLSGGNSGSWQGYLDAMMVQSGASSQKGSVSVFAIITGAATTAQIDASSGNGSGSVNDTGSHQWRIDVRWDVAGAATFDSSYIEIQ